VCTGTTHVCMQKVRVPQLLYYVAAVGVEIQEARDQRPETRDQHSYL
jgi:hypothetical protein